MTIEFNNYDELVCKCGSEYLHQEAVTIFWREEYPIYPPKTVISMPESTTFFDGAAGNPSRVKPGLLVTFKCEQCGDKPVLAISQRKGCTSIKWR